MATALFQPTLFANPVDEFFFALENPPETYEDECTAELWQRAFLARQYAGSEAVEFTQYDIDEQDDEPMAGTTPEYSEGFKCGSAGGSALNCPYKRNTWVRQQWEAGFTAGIAIFRRDRCEEAVTESRGMRLGADCRVVRGRAEY